MRIDTSARRVRHEIADGVAPMAFSPCSVALAGLIALVLGAL